MEGEVAGAMQPVFVPPPPPTPPTPPSIAIGDLGGRRGGVGVSPPLANRPRSRTLSALGLLWGWLYVRSGNLVVPILVHALWNSRIFLQSLLRMVGVA